MQRYALLRDIPFFLLYGRQYEINLVIELDPQINFVFRVLIFVCLIKASNISDVTHFYYNEKRTKSYILVKCRNTLMSPSTWTSCFLSASLIKHLLAFVKTKGGGGRRGDLKKDLLLFITIHIK